MEDDIFKEVAPLLIPEDTKPFIDAKENGYANVYFGIVGYVKYWKPGEPTTREEVLNKVFHELFLKLGLAKIKDPDHICFVMKAFFLLRNRDAVRAIQKAICIYGKVPLQSSTVLDGADGLWGGSTLGAFKKIMNSEDREQFEAILRHEIYFVLRTMDTTDPKMYSNALKYFVQ